MQISDENIHHVREVMDEVFGPDNFISTVSFTSTGSLPGKTLPRSGDYIIWYAKDYKQIKYRQLFYEKPEFDENYKFVELPGGERRNLTKEETADISILPIGSKIYRLSHIRSQGKSNTDQNFKFEGRIFNPGPQHHWKTTIDGLRKLADKNRLVLAGNTINFIMYQEDFPVKSYSNLWTDTSTGGSWKIYVVQTNAEIVKRCILMTTDPGDIVLDPTCGSGTSAYVAEQWGRRWITIDTSRVALALARTRLMTAKYPYYKLKENEHVGM